ncbi:MAG: DUF1206 domain-containing protein [Aquaticitalea sp.]
MSIISEKIARFGLFSIGIVYVLIGILTALAAFNLGGSKMGTKGAIGYIANQPLGKILLIIMALGLFSYAFWRFYQTIFDSRQLGTDFKGLFARAGYFTGGLFYGFLGFIAIKLFFGGGDSNQQDLLISALNSKYGSYIAVAAGLILAGKAIFEIYFVASNNFKRNVKSKDMEKKVKAVLLKFGVIGHFARGLIFGLMAFLTIRAGLTIRSEKVSTVTDAFQFLKYKFGAVILAIVALGLLCYGLYMFVKSKYLYIDMD